MLEKPRIFNPSEKPVQVFLTDKVVQGYILEKILDYAAPASIVVSTFSTGEEFLRKVISLRKSGAILRASLFCDHKAAEKTARVNPMLFAAFDEVRFCKNHSKVMIIEGGVISVVVISSQNQTRGNRIENYAILLGADITEDCKNTLYNLPTYQLINNKTVEQ